MFTEFGFNISSFVGKCKRVNSVLFMCAFCKYFIAPFLVLIPCLVEASFASAAEMPFEYPRGFFVSGKNGSELVNLKSVIESNGAINVNGGSENVSGRPKRVAFTQSVVEKVSDPSHNENSTNRNQSQVSIAQNNSEYLQSALLPVLPMFIFTLGWCCYSVGYHRDKYSGPV